MDVVCSAEAVPYAEVLRIDEKLQAFIPHRLVFGANAIALQDITKEPGLSAWEDSRTQGNPISTVYAKEQGGYSRYH